jgi:uncharacterized SAM-binding protein YcdF (DUF218 family)
VALFVGSLCLAGAWAGLVFQAPLHRWWVDLPWLPESLVQGLTGASGVALLGFAFAPQPGRWRRWLTLGALAFFLAATAVNAAVFWWLLGEGRLVTRVPVPLSLGFHGLLWMVFSAVLAERRRELARVRPIGGGWREGAGMLAVAGACALAFPVAQAFGFGWTSYAREADLAVVFGARVYRDGRLSDAVRDRVHAAVELYRQGRVSRIVMSGGPGDGPVSEVEAMRREARRLGVPAAAILEDPLGWNTAATVRNTRPFWTSPAGPARLRVLAVSEFYHLPRIKLAYQGAGLEVYTVPARPGHPLRAWPLRSIAREIPAFWLYYGRAVSGRLPG